MKRSIYFLTIFSILYLSSLTHAATFNVIPNGSSNCNSAPCDLQSALDAAAINGEDNVLNLAAGKYDAGLGTFTYAPVVTTGTLNLVGDPEGGTIIDGVGNQCMLIDTSTGGAPDVSSDISVGDMTFQGGVTGNFGAGLGITTNNASVSIDHCKFISNTPQSSANPTGGGGLFITIQSLGAIHLSNSEFIKNLTASSGGGAFLTSLGGDVSLEGNSFIGNLALNSSSGGGGGGAFALSFTGSVTVDSNLFLNNMASLTGGGFLGEALESPGIFTNNIFSGNELQSDGSSPSLNVGGGLTLVTLDGSVVFANNTVTGNKAVNAEGGGIALALELPSATADIYNNIIFDNAAFNGTICPNGCNDIMNLDNGGGVFTPTNSGSVVNVFNNDYSDIFFQCDVNQGCQPHQNVDPVTNIHLDPLLASAGSGDFHLLPGSPAIDAGTAFGPVIPTKDFSGNPRNQGKGIDMGALEFSMAPTENCSNGVDDDGDGKIDCADPDCSGAAACIGNGEGITPNAGNNGGGCSLMSGAANPSYISFMTIPLLLIMRRYRRRS
jgi:hypothetical protein